jgi:hypothetical protein
MKISHSIFLLLLLLASCKNPSRNETPSKESKNGIVATQFVDAFYSFNRDSLEAVLSSANDTKHNIFYYQKWAECGNYQVIERGDYIEKSDTLVLFPVTVKDDLIGALKLDMHVTDTFHLTIQNGQIRSIKTSSNDPELFHQAREWVGKNRPELFEKDCAVFTGPAATPCECVKGMVKGFAEFVVSTKSN